MNRFRLVIALLLLANASSPVEAEHQEQRLRRPVALSLSENGRWLYTANRDSGSISVIDTSTRSVFEEVNIGGRLSDLAVLDDTNLLALDEQNHQLVLLKGGGVRWIVAARLNLAFSPVRICVDKESRRCFVSSLWSRAVTLVDLSEVNHEPDSRLRVAKSVQLSFEPREMCLVMDATSLIVASSFSSSIAVLKTDGLELVSTREIPGHNIRGLAVSSDGKRLFVTQQELNSLARSTRDDVHWGNMVANLLVALWLDDVCDPHADIHKKRIVHYLGEPGHAAGDPGPIEVGVNGELAILLAGVNELALGSDENAERFQRVPVGRRPIAIESAPQGTLYVANMFSDSVSIVDMTNSRQAFHVSLGPVSELSPAELGETLFFDSRLSHDGWMSCHSCHSDGHSSEQLNDNLSDGSFETPKRVLSLLGVAQTGPWAWNGEIKSLEQQVSRSIEDTMQGTKPTGEQIASLVAYLKTLPVPPPLSEAAEGRNAGELIRGRELFQSLECQHCHVPPHYTSALAYNVGLTDVAGNSHFNPPSLCGVGRRKSFFHDASTRSLMDVLTDRKHQLNRELSNAELELLLLFLQSI